MKGNKKKYLKSYLIVASLYPGYRDYIQDVEYAYNLRDAWRFFKLHHSGKFRFHYALSNSKRYFNLY